MSESGRQVKGWFIPEYQTPHRDVPAFTTPTRGELADIAARRQRQRAKKAQDATNARRRGIAYALDANGAPRGEIAKLLKISSARVAQLIAFVQIRTEQAADRRFPLREPWDAQEFADRQALREGRIPGHPSPRALALNCVLDRDHAGKCRPCYR